MSSGFERAILDVAGRIGDRKHHGALAENPAPPRLEQLRLAEHRVPEAEQMADLVNGDRLDVEARRLAAAATDQLKFEFRKMSDSRIAP